MEPTRHAPMSVFAPVSVAFGVAAFLLLLIPIRVAAGGAALGAGLGLLTAAVAWFRSGTNLATSLGAGVNVLVFFDLWLGAGTFW